MLYWFSMDAVCEHTEYVWIVVFQRVRSIFHWNWSRKKGNWTQEKGTVPGPRKSGWPLVKRKAETCVKMTDYTIDVSQSTWSKRTAKKSCAERSTKVEGPKSVIFKQALTIFLNVNWTVFWVERDWKLFLLTNQFWPLRPPSLFSSLVAPRSNKKYVF